jgi:hypothetical protein
VSVKIIWLFALVLWAVAFVVWVMETKIVTLNGAFGLGLSAFLGYSFDEAWGRK